jgi:hypothetical protein
MLSRGATIYDVAKLLGDAVETVEHHYADFVPELRERTRRIMENDEGGLQAFASTKTKKCAQKPPNKVGGEIPTRLS